MGKVGYTNTGKGTVIGSIEFYQIVSLFFVEQDQSYSDELALSFCIEGVPS